ncbi:MAG: rRNA maturation RNase YbeY [Spirochaetia bacterium]
MNNIETVNIQIQKAPWMDTAADFIDQVLRKLGIDNWEISVVFTNNTYIQELNSTYRDIDSPTDILSFSQLEGEFSQAAISSNDTVFAGDIIISLEKAESQAKKAGISLNEEMKRLLIHGILHLQGMDHPEENSQMLTMQEDILKNFMEETVI